MKIVTIVGARPQFVKAAAVSHSFRAYPNIEEVLVHTGQHYDEKMSDIFFNEMQIPAPRYQLAVGSQSHGKQTGLMLEAIERVLQTEKPDWVLLYGDTNSTLAGALAAAKIHQPVAHVEAGLRSFNKRMPEEINRIVTDHVSERLFVPTPAAKANLLREGISADKIEEVGDVMFDSLELFSRRAGEQSSILQRLGISGKPYILTTIHRAENTDSPERLANLVESLLAVAREMEVIFPVHPRTRGLLPAALFSTPGIQVIEPVGYFDMLALEQSASLIATDSGGIQKEAYFFKVPCVTLRDETEWVELVEMGWNRLAPPSQPAALASQLKSALGSRGREGNPFGVREASRRIAEALLRVPTNA